MEALCHVGTRPKEPEEIDFPIPLAYRDTDFYYLRIHPEYDGEGLFPIYL